MATKTKVDAVQMSNLVRQVSPQSYGEVVPVMTQSSPISDLANPLLQYSTHMNTFAKGLMDMIGMTVLDMVQNFDNPLAKYRRETSGLGIDTREIAMGLMPSQSYEWTTEGIAKMWKLYEQEYSECFHRLNRQVMYAISFSEKELKLALTSWNDLENLINQKIITLYESNYYEEFELMKETLRASVQNDGIKMIEVAEVTDAKTGNDFIYTVKNCVDSFQYRDVSNSPFGQKNPNTTILPVSRYEDVSLIVPYQTINKLKVDTLAGAFNRDELTFNVEVLTKVDDLGYIRTGEEGSYKYYKVDAIVCDKNYIRFYSDPDNGTNGNDLPTVRGYNTYLHIWETLSTSPFFCVNTLVHPVDETVIPEGYFENLNKRVKLIANGSLYTE